MVGKHDGDTLEAICGRSDAKRLLQPPRGRLATSGCGPRLLLGLGAVGLMACLSGGSAHAQITSTATTGVSANWTALSWDNGIPGGQAGDV